MGIPIDMLLFQGEVIYVLKQVNMGASQICSFVIGDACDDAYNPQHEWEVAFPPVNKPPIQPPIPPKEGAPTFKVLHISDTHYDPYYQEGSNAVCNEPLCCRLTNGAPLTASAAAGRWGDYRKCDTPKRTVDHMLKHIADTHSVSISYYAVNSTIRDTRSGAYFSYITTYYFVCDKLWYSFITVRKIATMTFQG